MMGTSQTFFFRFDSKLLKLDGDSYIPGSMRITKGAYISGSIRITKGAVSDSQVLAWGLRMSFYQAPTSWF